MPRFTDCEGNTRRDFIKIGAAGALGGLTLPELFRVEAQAAPRADRNADLDD